MLVFSPSLNAPTRKQRPARCNLLLAIGSLIRLVQRSMFGSNEPQRNNWYPRRSWYCCWMSHNPPLSWWTKFVRMPEPLRRYSAQSTSNSAPCTVNHKRRTYLIWDHLASRDTENPTIVWPRFVEILIKDCRKSSSGRSDREMTTIAIFDWKSPRGTWCVTTIPPGGYCSCRDTLRCWFRSKRWERTLRWKTELINDPRTSFCSLSWQWTPGKVGSGWVRDTIQAARGKNLDVRSIERIIFATNMRCIYEIHFVTMRFLWHQWNSRTARPRAYKS